MTDTVNTSLSESMHREQVTKKNGKVLDIAIPSGITGKELAQKNIPEPTWLIEEKIPVGTVALAAAPKSGKTIWSFQLAYAVATGGSFLGNKVEQGTVIYFDLEGPARRSKKRFEKMKLDISALDNLIIVNDGIQTLANGLEDQLIAYKQRYKDLKLVVIDTLSKVYPSITKDYNEETKIYNSLRKTATSLGITVLLVHHKSKYKNDADPFSGAYGTNALAGNCDVLISLSTKNKGDKEVDLFMEGNDIETYRVVCRFENLHWEVIGDPNDVATRKAEEAIRKSPVFQAIQMGLQHKANDGAYKFTIKEMINDSKYWGVRGYFGDPKSIATWLRQNQDMLEVMLGACISSKRASGGMEYTVSLVFS